MTGAKEIVVLIERSIESKSRFVPIISRSRDPEDGDWRYRIVSLAEPTTSLLESYISARARSAVHEHERTSGPWPVDSCYSVDIELGDVIGGRRTDLDNLAKVVLDGMTGPVFDRDNRVDRLSIERSSVSGTASDSSSFERTPTKVTITLLATR